MAFEKSTSTKVTEIATVCCPLNASHRTAEVQKNTAGAGIYAYINTGIIGTDAIKVAFIYKSAKVSPPVRVFKILDSSVDPKFIDTKNRPTLAQTFETPMGTRFTVTINHFKSKGSACNDVSDPDTGDGQGNCNLTRTDAAKALVNWLAADPTESGSPYFLILGDLNSYAKEDPITMIVNAGYTNLTEKFLSWQDAYSYGYMGQVGELDHALASAELLAWIDGVRIWHINADEPRALDYNNYNQAALYQPDEFQSADYDPVIVYVNFDRPYKLSLPYMESH